MRFPRISSCFLKNSPLCARLEQEQIKSFITTLMVSTPPKVQSQLCEALTIISQHDFPTRWKGLLPDLTQKLNEQSGDFAVVSGVLHTANSVFKRFRNTYLLTVRWALSNLNSAGSQPSLGPTAALPAGSSPLALLSPCFQSEVTLLFACR